MRTGGFLIIAPFISQEKEIQYEKIPSRFHGDARRACDVHHGIVFPSGEGGLRVRQHLYVHPAVVCISIIPILVMFLAMQRQFVAGLLGSVK
jgi:hypothetical protein